MHHTRQENIPHFIISIGNKAAELTQPIMMRGKSMNEREDSIHAVINTYSKHIMTASLIRQLTCGVMCRLAKVNK